MEGYIVSVREDSRINPVISAGRYFYRNQAQTVEGDHPALDEWRACPYLDVKMVRARRKPAEKEADE